MIWLGVHFPWLCLDVFLRGHLDTRIGTAPDRPPLAVCDRTHVLQACPLARQLGVLPGQKRATALALAPSLDCRERDPAREQRALAQAADWALQFTPLVSLQTTPAPGLPGVSAPPQPAGLLLEIEASLRLFGGREPLIARLRGGLADLGFTVHIACAPSATGAWLLARHQDGALADSPATLNARLASVPAHLLDTAQAHLETLEALGARQIKPLALLPRAGLARRFGRGLLLELDRAFGRVPEPREWHEAPATHQAGLELLADVEDAQALLFGARRLLVPLCGWLAARHAATRHLALHAQHDDAPDTTITLQPADPTRDADRLTALLREKLAVLRLRAPVHSLRLHCEDVVAQSPDNPALFPLPASARESLGRLIERLQARLGRDRVLRLMPSADHRPERAYQLACASVDAMVAEPAPPGRPAVPAPHWGSLPRPLWLLDPPQAIEERNNRPHWHGPLSLLAGPERIETGWWDNHLVQRDYFIACDDEDHLLWIYRERLPEASPRPAHAGGWFLQGRFG